jgi:DhnA family fructose-bisphosphate aldolase class Ia
MEPGPRPRPPRRNVRLGSIDLPARVPRPAEHAGRLPVPALVLAADHRARGVPTIENYADYVGAIRAALPHCDGILATTQPLTDLAVGGAVTGQHRTYLSLNRTGLAGSAFELDDRLITSVYRAAADGWTGIKHMTRIDRTDAHTAPALELLGRVIDEAVETGLEALIECVGWRDGQMARDTDTIVDAAVIAHDMGAPVLKVPVPDEEPGAARIDAVGRVVGAVGCPVLFLGGPWRDDDEGLLAEASDVMAGGGAGLAVGRAIIQHADPAKMAERVRDVVHGR